jgi:hypothetical protein
VSFAYVPEEQHQAEHEVDLEEETRAPQHGGQAQDSSISAVSAARGTNACGGRPTNFMMKRLTGMIERRPG